MFDLLLFPFYFLRRLFLGKGSSEQGIPLSVLMDYEFDIEGKREDGRLMWMVGRPPGWMSALLGLFGLNANPSITFNRKEVRFHNDGMFNEYLLVVPLEDVTVVDCRFEKPAWRLYLGIFLVLLIILSVLTGSSFDYRSPFTALPGYLFLTSNVGKIIAGFIAFVLLFT